MSWIGVVYAICGVSMALLWHVFSFCICGCSCLYKCFRQRKSSPRRALRFSISRCPWKVFEHFVIVVNVGVWCSLCCMLVEKKIHKVNNNTIKSRTIPPTYHKILSSPSSTFCTMTASIESFSVGF